MEAVPLLTLVGTFRHPLAVADSLHRRNRFPIAKSLELWQFYNQCLLDLQVCTGFPLVNFDLPDQEYQAKVQELLHVLDLSPPSNLLSFFEDSLRTTNLSREESLPGEVAGLYGALLSRAF